MNAENVFETSTLSTLVAKCPGGIRIPMIQRDYAQGRTSWENARNRFLNAIKEGLCSPERLHLDFIYGVRQTEDGIEAFCPLDGQQRITTLFLLHWYLAARDGCCGEFQRTFRTINGDSRFTYQVRPGGRSFFRCLVNHHPEPGGVWKTEPSAWINAQSWFRTGWSRDPTVAGALTMLDAIAEVFSGAETSYEQLATGNRISFEVLDLAAAGLHDDLYLRMNARGRPLTPYETFKARYEKHLETAFPAPYTLARCGVQTVADFSRKIDNQWLDFVWGRFRPKSAGADDTSSVDKAFMNLFRAVALISLPPKEGNSVLDVAAVTSLQGDADYDDFETGNWLTPIFTTHFIHVMESCERARENCSLLLQERWFENTPLLDRVLRYDGAPVLIDYLQFAACVRFLTRNGPLLDERLLNRFFEWMRVVRNLVLNTEVRADVFRQMLLGLDELLQKSEDILGFLSTIDKISGFSKQQVQEERLKALLIRADDAWRPLIESAENHGYFRGQIAFLLKFSGAGAGTGDQSTAQEHFKTYWLRAQEMFGPAGLNSKSGFLWERALLGVGDFLLEYGGASWSFLTNDRDSPVSWKRLLRGPHDQRCAYLKVLWDRMAKETLEQIAADLPHESWRYALCSTPAAWDYCRQRLIHFEERESKPPRVFLLSSRRRRAAYVELFTYRLLKQEALDEHSGEARFSPLRFKNLVQHTGVGDDPHLVFELTFQKDTLKFQLYCQYKDDGGFSLWIADTGLAPTCRHSLEQAGFNPETWYDKAFFVHRQDPANADPLDGSAFLDSVATTLRGILPQS